MHVICSWAHPRLNCGGMAKHIPLNILVHYKGHRDDVHKFAIVLYVPIHQRNVISFMHCERHVLNRKQSFNIINELQWKSDIYRRHKWILPILLIVFNLPLAELNIRFLICIWSCTIFPSFPLHLHQCCMDAQFATFQSPSIIIHKSLSSRVHTCLFIPAFCPTICLSDNPLARGHPLLAIICPTLSLS